MTPFVGREQEVALLVNRWRRAVKGEGQVVLLSGEAGIGKSRILAALRERIGGEQRLTFRYQCSPHHVNDAFYPVIGQIWQGAGFVSGEPAAVRLDKLEAMIVRAGCESSEIVPYLASLLAIPTEGRYPALEMAPSEVKERTIAAMIALVVGFARTTPLLMLIEDAHWIDPTSLDLLGRIVEKVQALAVLLCGDVPARVHRALARPPAYHDVSPLNRFERSQAVTMIDRIMSRQGAAGGSARPDRRQDRRRAAVRGRTDQERAGIGIVARGERRLCARLPR